MSEKMNEMDRRDFLKRGGILLATTAVAVGGVSSLTGCQAPYVTSFAAKETLSYNFVKKISEAAAPHPYPYQKLDPTTCAERAYFGYFQRGGWGAAVAEGFFGELGEKAGYPFDQVNSESVKYAAGGFGMATLCGSLAVSAICIGSVVPGDDAKKLVAELFNFYKAAEFPEYQPEYQGRLKKSVSDSYLCNDSVGNFMKVQGVDYDSPVRKARCAGTAADTTRKMVELINAYYKL